MLKKIILSTLLFTSLTSSSFATVTASGLNQVNSKSPNYYADMWYRDSAERTAIYREVFFLGEQVIRQRVATQHLKPHQWGVILDIDETTLNNSQWGYDHDIKGMPSSWNAFAASSQSIALPGVKKFVYDIHQMGGYVNFVSNRSASLQAATEKNLKSQSIYFDQVLLDASEKGTSFVDKNTRFNAIVNGQAPSKFPAQVIVAWFGDNIQDFPGLYQKEMIKQNPNEKAYQNFGVQFFALPNPMYGSWEKNPFN